jgi:hypothetical protein
METTTMNKKLEDQNKLDVQTKMIDKLTENNEEFK